MTAPATRAIKWLEPLWLRTRKMEVKLHVTLHEVARNGTRLSNGHWVDSYVQVVNSVREKMLSEYWDKCGHGKPTQVYEFVDGRLRCTVQGSPSVR